MPGRKSLGIITSHDHPSTISHRASRDESKKRRRQREYKSEWWRGATSQCCSIPPLHYIDRDTEERDWPIRYEDYVLVSTPP